jgi:hypothetical protein
LETVVRDARRILRWLTGLLVLAALAAGAWRWLDDHPEHVPWAPLRIDEPTGWATRLKLARLRDDVAECRGFLTRSDIAFTSLPPLGEGECRRSDRTLVSSAAASGLDLRPRDAAATCAVNAGLALWLRHDVQPAAEGVLGSRVVRIEHLGTANCRRIGGGETGPWSEHATGNAIDVSAFVLADGRRISVLRDWPGSGDEAAFLRVVRDRACQVFGTVLSPDYNAAHRDHFHLDQAGSRRGWSFCR